MFKSHYQGGAHVEVFSAQGKDPAAKWKQSGKVQRIFDKCIKSYVYMLEGGPGTKMQIPREEKQGLSLTQQFIVLQVSVPLGVGFNVQILATDTLNSKRRIFLSSAHKDISHTPLHTRLPLGMMTRGQWVNLAVNVGSIVTGVFHSTLKSTELIVVSASCKLRKVFTMKHQPHNTNTGIYSPCYDGPTETIPKSCTLNIGTITQVIDISVIRQWVENQQPKLQREAITKSAPQNPLLRAKPAPRNAHSAEMQRKVQGSLDTLNKQTTARNKRQTKPDAAQPITGTKSKCATTPIHVVRGKGATTPSRTPRQAQASRQANNADQLVSIDESRLDIDTSPPVTHSTPNPLMDRVLDLSFGASHTSGEADSPRQDIAHQDRLELKIQDNQYSAENMNLINNISNGNLTFRSNSSTTSKASNNTPLHKSPSHSTRHTRHSTRRSREASHSRDSTRHEASHSRDSTRHEASHSRDSTRHSREKVYNSKDYEDTESNPFAASDEDLKYRMKALALYNGDLEDSMDFSTTSRRSKRSMGVGPPALSDEEVEEKLGEDTDTSSSDATVLSHAQELLLSGSVGHTSFLQDSLGNTHENRLTDRAYSPPICYPDELTRQATLPHHPTTTHNTIEEDSEEEELDLLYDPVLNCYFDPKTCKYYELA